MSKPLPIERAYESMFICPSDTPQRTIDAFVEKIKTALEPVKGTVKTVQVWGRRRLVYPIKHNRDGLYVFIDFIGQGGSPDALKKLFLITDFILRFIITDKVVLTPPPPKKVPVVEGAEAAKQAVPAATEVKGTPSPIKEA